MSQTLDSWVEENASKLFADVKCHINAMTDGTTAEDDDLARLIMVSIRDHYSIPIKEIKRLIADVEHDDKIKCKSWEFQLIKERILPFKKFFGGENDKPV